MLRHLLYFSRGSKIRLYQLGGQELSVLSSTALCESIDPSEYYYQKSSLAAIGGLKFILANSIASNVFCVLRVYYTKQTQHNCNKTKQNTILTPTIVQLLRYYYIMTNALQVLYSAEYFLRRQLSEGGSGPTGYAYNNGDTQYDEFINNDNNNNYNDSLYSSTLSPQEQSTIMEGDPHNNNNNNNSSHSQGRTVLTILYLCVLGLCFVVPVFYYFRLHCFEEHARREMELDFAAALEHSEQNRDEARAARRKYIDERRARILQLMGPVRMVR